MEQHIWAIHCLYCAVRNQHQMVSPDTLIAHRKHMEIALNSILKYIFGTFNSKDWQEASEGRDRAESRGDLRSGSNLGRQIMVQRLNTPSYILLFEGAWSALILLQLYMFKKNNQKTHVSLGQYELMLTPF